MFSHLDWKLLESTLTQVWVPKSPKQKMIPLTPRTQRRPADCHYWKQCACGQETSPQWPPSSSLHSCSRSGWTWPSAYRWSLPREIGKRRKSNTVQAKSLSFLYLVEAEGSWESAVCLQQTEEQAEMCDRCLMGPQGRGAATGTHLIEQNQTGGGWVTVYDWWHNLCLNSVILTWTKITSYM